MSESKDMSFWEHFDVFRGTLLRIAVVIVVLLVGFFIFMPEIFENVVLAPCHADFPLYRLFESGDADGGPFSVSLVNIQLASQLFIHLSASFNMAIVFGFPIIIYLLWRFVRPGLDPNERRHAVRAFLCGNLMFYAGVATGYFLVFPITLRFLSTYQLSPEVPNVISIDSYMDYFTMIILVMGIVFELPVVGWMLGKAGLLTRRFFNRYRRHAIVVLLIAAALITPTGDPVTLFVVFIPLWLLFEFTASLVPKSK